MKLSMWMIAEKLREYAPICDIKTGDACIYAVRFISDTKDNTFEPEYVYLCVENENGAEAYPESTIVLINGQDLIMVHDCDMEDVLNSVLAAFEFYNSWESGLWNLSAGSDLQTLLDYSSRVLDNPAILSDPEGNVLAMSSKYLDRDLNENWVYCKETRQLPTAILGSPHRNNAKEPVLWSDKPQIMYLPDGTKTIGCFLQSEGQTYAALGLWELDNPIHPGHLTLVEILCEVILTVLKRTENLISFGSSVTILSDLLDGVAVDEILLQRLALRCEMPWRLLCVHTPFQTNIVSLKNLLKRMSSSGISCIPFEYQGLILCLAPAGRWEEIVRLIFGKKELQYYVVIVSMVFDNLHALQTRYHQNLFCLKAFGDKPGIYLSESQGLPCAVSLLADNKCRQEFLSHPALETLSVYDGKNGTDFYQSLYYYLLYERSIQAAAQAVHVHRNSFLYRIKRILSLTGIDLEDAQLRAYLLFSFYLRQGDAIHKPGL